MEIGEGAIHKNIVVMRILNCQQSKSTQTQLEIRHHAVVEKKEREWREKNL